MEHRAGSERENGRAKRSTRSRVRLDHTHSDIDGVYEEEDVADGSDVKDREQIDDWDEPTTTEVILVSRRTFERFATETRHELSWIKMGIGALTGISLAQLIVALFQ